MGGYYSTQRKHMQTLGAAANNSSTLTFPLMLGVSAMRQIWIMNAIQWTSERPVAPAQPLPLLPPICNHVLTRTLSVSAHGAAWSQDYAASGEHHFQTGIVCTCPDRPEVGPECSNQRGGNWEGCACVCQPRAAHFVLVAKVRKKP